MTGRVKAGKKATLTLTFSAKPSTTVTVQRVTVVKRKKHYAKVVAKKVKTKVAKIAFPVGTKPGKLTFRALYQDGKVNRATATFTVKVVR